MILCKACQSPAGQVRFENPFLAADVCGIPLVMVPGRVQFNLYCECGEKTEFPVNYKPRKSQKLNKRS